MTRLPTPLTLALTSALLAACAHVTPESKDPTYVRGRSDYVAGRWPEAQESLGAFLESNCRSGPATGCERATWMKVQTDLQMQRPAQAVADADRGKLLGPPKEPLDPPLAALRAQALTQLAGLEGDQRTARLEVSFRDDTRAGCQLLAFTFALNLAAAQAVPLDRLDGRSLLFDPQVRPGDHLLMVSASFECPIKVGTAEMLRRASHAFLVDPAKPVKVLVRTYVRTDMAPLAPLPDKVAFDFQSP
jgi:hypothetical protein